REKDFDPLAHDFHQRFNARAPSWDAVAPPASADNGLEAFPHIIGQLVGSWGTLECRDLLDRLLHDNRDGRRNGFSLAAYEDLLMLRQLCAADVGTDAGAARRPPRPAPVAPPAPAAATPALSATRL